MTSTLCGFFAGVGIMLAVGASTESRLPGRFQVTSIWRLLILKPVAGAPEISTSSDQHLPHLNSDIARRAAATFFKPKAE